MDTEADTIVTIIDTMEDHVSEHIVKPETEVDCHIHQTFTIAPHQVGTLQKHIDTLSEHGSKICRYGFT